MLMRFSVANHYSIRDHQELSLVASSLRDRATQLISVEGLREKFLPVVGIYGANASGKSNFLWAINFMCKAILHSHTGGSAAGGVPRHPFLLDAEARQAPSQFDCDVLIDGIRYHYGFVIDDQKVLEEWLYVYPARKRQVWFVRRWDSDPVFLFGKALRGKNQTIRSLTRDNALFLSAAAQNNHEQLSKVYEHFKNTLMFRLTPTTRPDPRTSLYLEKDEEKKRIIDFLRMADIGIATSQMEEIKLSEDSAPFYEDLTSLIKKYVKDDIELPPMEDTKTLKLGHRASGGEHIFLELEAESRGTLRLLSILGPIFEALKKGGTIVIDELNTSMHPLLSRKLIELFGSSNSNTSGAQFIFTTHDTNLICGDVLRRDQVWFTEKDKEGATHLFPLTDFRTRNTDNVERGYLQGRFGAIPFLGEMEELFDGRED